ncbi:MAG: hypothetical protein M3487_00215 [Actinomycetota bacterium]|nr:hypothetical protein [Acidimicrobiia bacterium]MDQ3468191.1 hypothetical protein [Actinomycetota bacterium]
MTRTVGLSRRLLAGITGGVLVMASSCSGGDDPSDTLGPLDTTAPASVGTAVSAGSVATSGATTPSGPVGSGFVSIQIRLASSGIEEVIALDRATVAAADLVPISLDAGCTALDGGDGLDVAVTDLRRLSGGNRVISARLHVDPPTDAPGAYEGTLEIGDGQQVVTTYRGDVTLDEGMASGSFDVTDDSGGVATGSFVCAAQPVTTTTAPVSGGGEQVPGASAPVTGPAVPTLPPVIETLPPLTVPEATS